MDESIQNTNTIMQDKSKFITDILDYSIKKKLDDKTKARLINLISKEFEKTGIVETEIIERLSKIEKRLSGGEETQKKEKGPSHPLPKPKETYSLLKYFSSNEGGIKNLTHAFNLDFIEYDTFISQCKDEFENGKRQYPNVPGPLLKRIEEFAFSEKPEWYIRKGEKKKMPELGWSEPKFVEWYKTEKKHPWYNDKYKNKMIIPFRESIRIRSDSENLYKLIIETIELTRLKDICKVTMDEDGLKHADFYTDVDNLGHAIFKMFSTMKDMAIKNFCDKIEVGFYTDDEYKVLYITHINSKSTKRSDDKDFLGGDLISIRKNLWGLCNYEIRSNFPDGCFRKIILTDSMEELNKAFPIESVKGFTHVLKFY